MVWVYKQTEATLWTVGFYYDTDQGQKWEPESDHGTEHEAAARVYWLNGGRAPDETLVTPEMRTLADKVRSMCADYDAAQTEYEQGRGNSDLVIDLAEKLSDLAGDLARLVNPQN